MPDGHADSSQGRAAEAWTPRRRLLAVLHGRLPDRVPCCPDISNMVPCRLTGRPFWHIYAYKDPPLWKAYIDAVRHFGIDGGFELYDWGPVDPLDERPPDWTERIVHRRDDGAFVTRRYFPDRQTWSARCTVYTADNPPATNVAPGSIGLPETPLESEPLTGVKDWPTGMELWKLTREYLGDHGVIGLQSGCGTCVLSGPEDVYRYHDDPECFRRGVAHRIEAVERRMARIAEMDPRPDFLLCGGSGSLVWQTPETFRRLALPVLKRTTELAAQIGIPTHVHSCGPEAELVRMAAEETDLTVIDPLEVPPMGDCDLAELKRRYGHEIVLKGNLHTTETMLRGGVEAVRAAARKAIAAAGPGGGFILSTGDQCGRDTPDENLRALVDTAETHGRYRPDGSLVRQPVP